MNTILSSTDTQVLLIGVGNEFRNDDGLGVYVARELRRRFRQEVRIIEECGEGTALMSAWSGATHVLIVDAISTNELAGTLHRFDAVHNTIPKRMFASSSHQFGVAEAVELARELNELPETLTLYGIEAESFEAGIGLSESVVRRIPDLIHLVEHDIEQLASRTRSCCKGR